MTMRHRMVKGEQGHHPIGAYKDHSVSIGMCGLEGRETRARVG